MKIRKHIMLEKWICFYDFMYIMIKEKHIIVALTI